MGSNYTAPNPKAKTQTSPAPAGRAAAKRCPPRESGCTTSGTSSDLGRYSAVSVQIFWKSWGLRDFSTSILLDKLRAMEWRCTANGQSFSGILDRRRCVGATLAYIWYLVWQGNHPELHRNFQTGDRRKKKNYCGRTGRTVRAVRIRIGGGDLVQHRVSIARNRRVSLLGPLNSKNLNPKA